MSDQEEVDGLTAAEDYRVQLQAATGRKTGFETQTPEQFQTWVVENRPMLDELVAGYGFKAGDIQDCVDEYIEILGSVAVNGPFDDLNGTYILAKIVERIEKVCASGSIPVHDGVAYGVTPQLGLDASQLAVMGTRASIITVTLGFPIFCGMVSKAVAMTMVHGENSADWDPAHIEPHLRSKPEVIAYWVRLLTSYATYGWPPERTPTSLSLIENFTRLRLLEALELFAVAHEYGHHVLDHGVCQATDEIRDVLTDECEADMFGRLICLVEGMNSAPPNLFSASGVGGVLMLGALDLVRRTKALLETGSPDFASRVTHPPLDERIAVMAEADSHVPASHSPIFEEMRRCARELLETVWQTIEPVIFDLHKAGVRPQAEARDVSDWLPLGPRS